MASYERIRLDDLVLVEIASHLHFIDRIFHERVNGRYAHALQGANSASSISLTINKNKWVSDSPFTFVKIDQLDEEDGTKSRKQLRAPENKLTEAFELIFARFSKIRLIEIHAEPVKTVTESILAAISNEYCQLRELRYLKYSLDKAVNVDFRLINAFSPIIQNLTLKCSMPTTETVSKQLWTSVASCTKLQKLIFFPRNSIIRCSRDGPKFDTFSNVHLRECLKVCKIRHFRSGYNARPVDSEWLTAAFSNNENIRKLFIDDFHLRLSTFTTPTVLPIISKLRTFGMDFGLVEKPDKQANEIMDILSALGSKGYPTITQKLDYSILSLREEDRVGLEVKDSTEIEEALKFWLYVSDQTACFIKLLLTLFTDPIPVVTTAIKLIRSTIEFGDLIVEQKPEGMLLGKQNARVLLSICNVTGDKPITCW